MPYVSSERAGSVIRLVLSFPSRDLHPNARVHWARKAKAVKAYRTEAWAAALQLRLGRPMWRRASVRTTFYVPNAHRRDPDGLASSCKAIFDGIVDAGVLADDDQLVIYPATLTVDRVNPRVEIALWPIAEQTPKGA